MCLTKITIWHLEGVHFISARQLARFHLIYDKETQSCSWRWLKITQLILIVMNWLNCPTSRAEMKGKKCKSSSTPSFSVSFRNKHQGERGLFPPVPFYIWLLKLPTFPNGIYKDCEQYCSTIAKKLSEKYIGHSFPRGKPQVMPEIGQDYPIWETFCLFGGRGRHSSPHTVPNLPYPTLQMAYQELSSEEVGI